LHRHLRFFCEKIRSPPHRSVADNNGYGLKVFAFLKLADVPFRHEHIFDASKAPRAQLPYIVDGDDTVGDSETILSFVIHKYRLTIDAALSPAQRTFAIIAAAFASLRVPIYLICGSTFRLFKFSKPICCSSIGVAQSPSNSATKLRKTDAPAAEFHMPARSLDALDQPNSAHASWLPGSAIMFQNYTLLIAAPEVFGLGKIRDALFLLLEVVDFYDFNAIGGVGVFEDFRVAARLLHGIGCGLVAGLGLDHGKRKVSRITQKIVHPLRRLADKTFANGNDALIRDGALLGDGMGFVIPPSRLQVWDDEFSASIGLVRHLAFFPATRTL
jgi:hypothetical protein